MARKLRALILPVALSLLFVAAVPGEQDASVPEAREKTWSITEGTKVYQKRFLTPFDWKYKMPGAWYYSCGHGEGPRWSEADAHEDGDLAGKMEVLAWIDSPGQSYGGSWAVSRVGVYINDDIATEYFEGVYQITVKTYIRADLEANQGSGDRPESQAQLDVAIVIWNRDTDESVHKHFIMRERKGHGGYYYGKLSIKETVEATTSFEFDKDTRYTIFVTTEAGAEAFSGDAETRVIGGNGKRQGRLLEIYLNQPYNIPPVASFQTTNPYITFHEGGRQHTIHPLRVEVDGSSSYDPDGWVVSWAWNWGDDKYFHVYDEPTASHIYTVPDDYPITLRVWDNGGGDGPKKSFFSRRIYVMSDPIVEEPYDHAPTHSGIDLGVPVATFTPLDRALVGQSVSLSAEGSYDVDGTITSYDWDFGDGAFGSGEIVSHTFTSPGDQTVTLVVTDDSATAGFATATIPVDYGHDVSIVDVTPDKTQAPIGDSVTLRVIARNEGIFQETFSVDLYADSLLIDTQEFSNLSPDEERSLDYVWLTDGSTPEGSYTITAEASIVTDEVYTANNSYYDGVVFVPEPSRWVLLGVGLGCLVVLRGVSRPG